MLWQISQDVIHQFVRLGAVSVGCMTFPKRHFTSGIVDSVPNTDIVYFFDAEGREVGYWTVISPWFGPMILAPNYRNWDAYFLDRLHREDIPIWHMTPPEKEPS